MINFARELKIWYKNNARDLPWRTTRNPYKIWLSEVILQQTQVKTGLPYFVRIVEKYPDVSALAKANSDEFRREWQGLGYYRRADNLLKAARQIVNEFDGAFPSDYQDILSLVGVGEYTAAAIASFAFDEPVPVIDGNVKRVISRMFGIRHDLTKAKGNRELKQSLASVFDVSDPATFNQAIMEFGALQCTKSPHCEVCPFKAGCLACEWGLVSEIPLKPRTKKRKKRYFHYFIHRSHNMLAFQQRDGKDIWNGLYEFPLIELEEACRDAGQVKNFVNDIFKLQKCNPVFLGEVTPHILSHQEIYAFVFLLQSDEKIAGLNYYTMEEVERLPKSSLISRILEHNDVSPFISPAL